MELQTARGIWEIPRSWDQGGGHDPGTAFQGTSNMSSEEGSHIYILAYQVAAHTTPLPRSCALIVLNSKFMYCEKYRTKGRISRTPSYMTPKPVRTFIIVPEMEWTRCFPEFFFSFQFLMRFRPKSDSRLDIPKSVGVKGFLDPTNLHRQTLDYHPAAA